MKEKYPQWICSECGLKYGRYGRNQISSVHIGKCGWCKNKVSVTEPRDYGYPSFQEPRKDINDPMRIRMEKKEKEWMDKIKNSQSEKKKWIDGFRALKAEIRKCTKK